MNNRTVALRYAKVLFALDRSKENLEQRLRDLESMINILKDNPKLVNFLTAPHVNIEEKKKVLQNSLKGVFDLPFIHFLLYLIQKNRLINLRYIADEFRLMVNEYLGIWEANIVTAMPLDHDAETTLKKKLEKDFHKKIRLNKKIDPQIIAMIE